MCNRFLLALLFFGFVSYAQIDSTEIAADTVFVPVAENGLSNAQAMNTFWQKLLQLQKTNTGKVNIVHIGDSHILADLMSGKVRKNLQGYFGNAGRGLVFPYKLAKTNGPYDVRFSSDDNWDNRKNVSAFNGSPIGLSGIMLKTKSDDFSILLDTKVTGNYFNTLKIITPHNRNSFAVAIDKKSISVKTNAPKTISHTIKNGETLSEIAEKYDVSITELKKANKLKSASIRAGKKIKIPTNEPQMVQKSVFDKLPLVAEENCHSIAFKNAQNNIYLLPSGESDDCVLNGIVLENNDAGILYHNIGVNGAQMVDYIKYPMFFEQLKALNPDLIVVSFGTNESFSKKSTAEFMQELDTFLQNIKNQIPTTEFLITTPPPSLFERKIPNDYVADYSRKLLEKAEEKQFAVWDLYSQMGGNEKVGRNFRAGLMAGDRVHFSVKGYEKQGNLMSAALLKTFENYKTQQN